MHEPFGAAGHIGRRGGSQREHLPQPHAVARATHGRQRGGDPFEPWRQAMLVQGLPDPLAESIAGERFDEFGNIEDRGERGAHTLLRGHQQRQPVQRLVGDPKQRHEDGHGHRIHQAAATLVARSLAEFAKRMHDLADLLVGVDEDADGRFRAGGTGGHRHARRDRGPIALLRAAPCRDRGRLALKSLGARMRHEGPIGHHAVDGVEADRRWRWEPQLGKGRAGSGRVDRSAFDRSKPIGERDVGGWPEDLVDQPHDRRVRSMARGQVDIAFQTIGSFLCHMPDQRGRTATPAIDRLLGITDHDESSVIVGGEDLVHERREHAVLVGARVLALIDRQVADRAVQAVAHGLQAIAIEPVRAGKRRGDLRERVAALGAADRRGLVAEAPRQRKATRDAALDERGFDGQRVVQERADGCSQVIVGKALGEGVAGSDLARELVARHVTPRSTGYSVEQLLPGLDPSRVRRALAGDRKRRSLERGDRVLHGACSEELRAGEELHAVIAQELPWSGAHGMLLTKIQELQRHLEFRQERVVEPGLRRAVGGHAHEFPDGIRLGIEQP